ncbi:MAG: sensor histidine kinase [Oscillospiraceae bacterium]
MKQLKKISKKFQNKLSLTTYIWVAFMGLTIAVIILMWLFQVVFLQKFYITMKTHDVKEATIKISQSYNHDGYEKVLDDIAKEYSVAIRIVSRYGMRDIYSNNDYMSGVSIIHGFADISSYVMKIQNSDGYFSEQILSPRSNTDTILVGTAIYDKIGDVSAYLLINSNLEPIGSTVDILQRQLVLISIILLVISFALSYFISKKIVQPIDRITKSAKRLADGEYDIKFEGGNYLESTQLANTLTYASKQISKVDKQQRDLIANVSHDLRTPLTMIKAYAEMIRDLSGDKPAKREEHLNIIIEETDRLSLLVNDMLDLSKLENGGISLTPVKFDIMTRLTEIVERYKGLSEKMGYHIVFTPSTEAFVECDIVKIEQVIYNLINNAVNYTGDDKMVYINQINEEDWVKITVRDTGQGISKEDLKLIFDKYYRAKTRREVIGTGLGLSIVKAILNKHKFPYGVQSELGEGTTFWFKIKRCEPPKDDEQQ